MLPGALSHLQLRCLVVQAMSALVALQHLSLTGCNRVQGDALTALATLTALR